MYNTYYRIIPYNTACIMCLLTYYVLTDYVPTYYVHLLCTLGTDSTLLQAACRSEASSEATRALVNSNGSHLPLDVLVGHTTDPQC